MITIGVVLGGPEVASAPVGRLVRRLARHVEGERGEFQFGSTAAVNVVFHVPGSILRETEHEGLRDAKFSRVKKLLMVQVAVPPDIASSTDEEAIERFLFWALREANGVAAAYFAKKRMEYSQQDYLALMDAVETKFRGAP